MINLQLNTTNLGQWVSEEDIHSYMKTVSKNFRDLYKKQGKGNEFTGWVELPGSISEELVADIEETAEKIKQHSQVLVVIGIGGSYLGARAVIEALGNPFQAYVQDEKVEVLYAGQNLSEDYLAELLRVLDKKDYSIAVISKSGTTTEPAIAFRIIKQHLENKYKDKAAERIIAITDKDKGALLTLAKQNNYKRFIVPDDVGGRYSVLTPVGLLPIAVAGYDIRKLLEGAKRMQDYIGDNPPLRQDPVGQYAAIRNHLYQKGKSVEVMASFQPNLFYFIEWWKQLFGESEGKEQKALFPAGLIFTTDLHSLGQYMQDGKRQVFETVLSVQNNKHTLRVPQNNADLDGLNYISGQKIDHINKKAETATILAHEDGGVPVLQIQIPEVNEENLGELIYFFEISCAISAYTLGVNPFDQPGVEDYKKNMFALLGKKGYEKQSEILEKRLKK